MFKNLNIPLNEIIGLGGSMLLWYWTIYPFGGSYAIDDINMNFFALVILFTIVFAQVLSMVEDHRLSLLVSLGGILELLVWERMMGFGFGPTVILLLMAIIFLGSYRFYPKPLS